MRAPSLPCSRAGGEPGAARRDSVVRRPCSCAGGEPPLLCCAPDAAPGAWQKGGRRRRCGSSVAQGLAHNAPPVACAHERANPAASPACDSPRRLGWLQWRRPTPKPCCTLCAVERPDAERAARPRRAVEACGQAHSLRSRFRAVCTPRPRSARQQKSHPRYYEQRRRGEIHAVTTNSAVTRSRTQSVRWAEVRRSP